MSVEAPREFVDTNIFIYAHDASAGNKQAIARELIERLWTTGAGCLSVQVLQEFYVTVTRKVPQPMQPELAVEILRDLNYWRVHAPTTEDVLSAVDLQRRYQVAFWDAMILQSAISLGCRVLWSEDLSDSQVYHDVTVRNPFHGGKAGTDKSRLTLPGS